MQRFARGLLLAVFSFALFACHHDDSSSDSPPVVVTPPPAAATASFTAAASAPLNTPVVFDASASTPSNGSALQYVWDFGGGQRGGGKIIARQFSTAGSKSVKLTVIDGAGLSATQTKTVEVAAPTVVPATTSAQGVIKALDGTALQGVTVAPIGSSTTGITDAMGSVSLTVNVGVPLTLKLSKAGYADQFLSVQVPSSAGSDAYFEAIMRTRDAALTLADAAAGGSLTGRDGAIITLPANALVNASGAAVTGAVDIAITPVDPTLPGGGGFPGQFEGVKPDGSVTSIVSYGTTEYIPSAGGQALQLAPGKTATIDIPLYATRSLDGSVLALGDTTPLWSLDEASGIWVQEGVGTVVESASSPSGLALRATVTHLSWWNADIGFDPFGPKPRCVYDTDIGIPGANDSFATATICNMLAEIDRGLSGQSNSGGRRQLAATQLSPVVAGFARRFVLPIQGGVRVAVPANVDIALSGTALNGTWAGRTVVNGAIGVEAEAIVKMRPIATTGPGAEGVTLPFDATRALETGQTALFSFTATAFKYARITVSSGSQSTLQGNVRLLQGSTVLASASYTTSPIPLIALLPNDATYTVEITGTANTPGSYRVQIETIGGVQSETLTFPFSITKPVPAYTTYRGNFTIAAPTTLFIASQYQSGVEAAVRLVGPSGNLFTVQPTYAATDTRTLSLQPGNYFLEVAPVSASTSTYRFASEQTLWESVAPVLPLDAGSSNNVLIDLVSDRNGKAVLGYARTFASSVGGNHTAIAYQFKRWSGTAWEDASSELVVERPCNNGAHSASFAFDSANNLVLAHSNSTLAGDNTSTTVRRYTAGAWQPIGPNDGKLPNASIYSGSCQQEPIVQIDASDRPVLAYRADNAVYVQRFDGTTWVDAATGGGASFTSIYGTFDLRIDPNDRVWFVLVEGSGGTPSVVRRLNPTPTPAWETIGANGGALPQTNTNGLSQPSLRFDNVGSPQIGAIAAVGSSVTFAGTIVYRFDGSAWSSTGGYRADGASYISNPGYGSFTVFDGEGVMAWLNTNATYSNAPIVQRNTASGWTPFGAGNGEIPQFNPHGIITNQAWQMRLSPVGNDLYMAVIAQPSSQAPFSIHLLRKTAF